jgi:hypothetical protein
MSLLWTSSERQGSGISAGATRLTAGRAAPQAA